MATKKRAASKPIPNPALTMTIGEYIDNRLTARACNGDFGGPGSLDPADCIEEILDEYLEANEGVTRYTR